MSKNRKLGITYISDLNRFQVKNKLWAAFRKKRSKNKQIFSSKKKTKFWCHSSVYFEMYLFQKKIFNLYTLTSTGSVMCNLNLITSSRARIRIGFASDPHTGACEPLQSHPKQKKFMKLFLMMPREREKKLKSD